MELSLLQILSFVLVLSALFAYLNERYLKLPSTISLMLLGLLASVGIQLVGSFFPQALANLKTTLEDLDFSNFLMDFMLSFLLFAGALHTDWDKIRNERGPIISFATLGVIISTTIVGVVTYFLLGLFHIAVPFIECLLFGALISPTDPIAVLSILKKAKVPVSMETKIVGESLFNDGVGVVVFIVIFRMAAAGFHEFSGFEVSVLLIEEILGGIGLGLIFGWGTYRMMKSIDHYQTEVILTLALVMGGYSLANVFHFSGPLAMVTAGLIIGNKGKAMAMSDVTLDYTFKFWEIIDEIMNALLFVLIGLELLVVPLNATLIVLGLIMIVIVLGARWTSIALPSYLFGFKKEFEPKTLSVMTWGGLRGGISIALALSIPQDMNSQVIVAMTYVIVLFSILVQGLTMERVVRKVLKPEA